MTYNKETIKKEIKKDIEKARLRMCLLTGC